MKISINEAQTIIELMSIAEHESLLGTDTLALLERINHEFPSIIIPDVLIAAIIVPL